MAVSLRFQRYAPALLALVVIGCGGEGQPPTSPPVTTPPPTSPPPVQTEFDKEVSVAFIGGSITNGAESASSQKWSYAIGQYLDNRFAKATVHDFSVSGTGSMFAAYRLGEELEPVVPDIAFIEFAVNDGGESRQEIWTYTDAIIDQLRSKNPKVIIVYVATTRSAAEATRRAGQIEDSVRFAREISEQNDIVFVDAGAALWKEVIENGADLAALIPDGVHPSATGQQIYAEAVEAAMAAFFEQDERPDYDRSAFGAETGYLGARLAPASIAGGDCRHEMTNNPSPYLKEWMVCDEGQAFQLQFAGSNLGFVQAVTLDSGLLSCTIDGTQHFARGFYLRAASNPPPRHVRMEWTDLGPGEHTAICIARAYADAPERNRVVISKFLLSEGQLLDMTGR